MNLFRGLRLFPRHSSLSLAADTSAPGVTRARSVPLTPAPAVTRRPHPYRVFVMIGLFMVTAASSSRVHAEPELWNPQGKESPEPYGYDVYTAPDLPWGYVDPEDPPATLDVPAPLGAGAGVLDVTTTVDRTAYSWFGAIEVTAHVQTGGFPVVDCDSVVVVSAVNPRVRAQLIDDGNAPDDVAGDGRYSGIFEIGAGEGEARPTGSYTVQATAYRGLESGLDASPTFSLYSVRRWTGISTSDLPDVSDDYTAFFATPNLGGGFHHTIRDFGLVRSNSVSDAQIRIPILPADRPISDLIVSGLGVSGVSIRNNVIEFTCDLTIGNVARVDIEFDSESDLLATRIDRYQTGDIGLRNFRNGYLIWNRYIHTAIMGSGFSSPHGPGCVVDLHVTDLTTGDPHSVDCMERVAVHLDNQGHNDGTGTYPSNVKWGGEALDWLQTADGSSMVFAFVSGGDYGLDEEVSVEREVEFYAGSRYFRHRYRVRNIDVVSHDFDFVWGREQWLYGTAPGSNRQHRDRGLLPEDPAAYGGEHRFAPSQIDGNWGAAFDDASFYSIGMLFPRDTEEAMPSYTYFLCDPPLGNFTGEYPIFPAGVCNDMPNIFFEKQLGVLAPGEFVDYKFYQWGGYGTSRQELTQVLETDADAVVEDPASVESGPASGRDHAVLFVRTITPNPFAHSLEIAFDLAEPSAASVAIFDIQGRQIAKLLDDQALAEGRHSVLWKGRDAGGRDAPSGVYLVRLDAGGHHESRKVVIQRAR